MSGKSNDFLQIVMLTFFLCAIFFAGWGGVMWWRLNSDLDERDRQHSELKKLELLLKDPKNQATWDDYKREQEARKQGKDNIAATIQSLVKAIPGKDLSWIQNSRSDPKDLGGNPPLTELTYTVNLGESQLRDYIYLLAKLESEQPHIKVADLEVSKRRGRDSSDNSYQGKIVFVTYY